MPNALWLADAIRDAGIDVVEVDGWQDRGHSEPIYDGGAFVSHHTADGPGGVAPSLNIVINGASYTAPGPLANILQSREPGEGNDKAYIIAAGTTYNAGVGGWNGISGNNRAIGNEIEHTGTEPLPQHRVETACRIAAACLKHMGYDDARNHCHHWEWSYPPGSKIDVCCGDGPGGKCDGDEWRALTTRYMQSGGEDMAQVPQDEWNAVRDYVFSMRDGAPVMGVEALLPAVTKIHSATGDAPVPQYGVDPIASAIAVLRADVAKIMEKLQIPKE